jgi:hypothetical protein
MKDNLQLIGQVILIVLGPLLAKHNISVGNDEIDKLLAALSEAIGIIWKFFHWHATPSAPAPLPGITGGNVTGATPGSQSGSARLLTLLFVSAISALCFVGFIVGCASIAPGNDPIVVNAERAQQYAESTFDLVLTIDNSNRPLWESKAPAFHDFCEWLRQPQQAFLADGTATNVQRDIAMQLNLDKVKLDYKASKVSSNAVLEAVATLESAERQASSWLSVITNAPAPGQTDIAPIKIK